MGTQRDIAKKIIKDKKANYVLALKGNQPTLHEHVREYFQICLEEKFNDIQYQFVRTAEKGHGRIAVREYYLITDVSWLKQKDDWLGLKSIGMVINKCERKGVKSKEIRYFIASITNANDFANAVWEHWGIESMHWQLDVTFKEDASRIRKDNGAENTAMLRKIALNILKLDKVKDEKQQSYKTKRFIASLDEEYLEKLMMKNILEIQ